MSFNKIYYHGGDLEITNFTYDVDKKNRTNNVAGFYFTDRKEKALSYGAKLTQVYLLIKNPFILGSTNANIEMGVQFRKELIKENPHIDKYDDWYDEKIQNLFQYNRLPFTGMDGMAEQRVYLAGGFDSIMDGDEVAVFNPKNIKIISSSAIHENMENKLKGGKADKMTPKDIADKFDIPVTTIKKQIEKGIKVEIEHTSDKEKAREIATDHVSEFADYYDRLNKMENKASKDWKVKDVTENTKTLIKRLIRENFNPIFKKIKIENKFTLPKIPINNVFKNAKKNISGLLKDVNIETLDKKNNEIVDISKIVPTQSFLNIDNLKKVVNVGYQTGAELIKYEGLYYVIDGHHRIGIEILKGNDSIKAVVYILK